MTALKSIPHMESMAGCTKIMYAIVIKVVRPAMNSVLMSVPRAFNSKSLSSNALIKT